MLKKAVILLAILAAIACGALWWAYENPGVVVKFALEYYGPKVMGVDVKVGEARISPGDGKGTVRGVEIGNPPGFSSARAVRLGEASVWVEPATIRSPIVLIHEIAVTGPAITYERAGGSNNLDAIQKRIAQSASAAQSAPTGTSTLSGEKRRYIIERIVIRGARVTMTNSALKGQGVTFDLPDIEMKNIGKDSGVTADEAAAIVAATVSSRIAQKVLTNIDLLRKGGVEGALDALKGLVH
ncbi:MAG TPA: hypothetical protein VKR38_16550 [Usitatibacter sp.]|nr:hypothetical protein [Usitatibacter sp.]